MTNGITNNDCFLGAIADEMEKSSSQMPLRLFDWGQSYEGTFSGLAFKQLYMQTYAQDSVKYLMEPKEDKTHNDAYDSMRYSLEVRKRMK